MLVIHPGKISSKVNKKIQFSSYLFEKKQIKMTYSHNAHFRCRWSGGGRHECWWATASGVSGGLVFV
jgi:hypothetical protein